MNLETENIFTIRWAYITIDGSGESDVPENICGEGHSRHYNAVFVKELAVEMKLLFMTCENKKTMKE